ncbi:MAG: adenylyl-sulfate kinase [Microbacterium sp.]|uniref:adenylyl-sulfate kinase n=1 Tax=Microbacterium sp. TaxID=51671 RepID=UPI0039E421DA
MPADAVLVLAGDRLEALELILGGALAPVNGYCLPDSKPDAWPVAALLEVAPSVAAGLGRGQLVHLCDPENTPLAELRIDAVASASGSAWLSGPVAELRPPAHGIARDLRITSATRFDDRVVALFGGAVAAADVLRAAQAAGHRGLDLVAVGVAGDAGSAALVADLRDAAALLPDARAWYLPAVDLGADADVARVVAEGRGAAEVVDLRHPVSAATGGAVVLFTGLSGAGKSTVARALVERVSSTGGHKAVLLDGDHVRHELAAELGFSRDDRDTNLRRIAWVGARVAEAGGLAVCAPIAPFASSRDAMRGKVEPDSPFVVVYVSTPLAVAESRDRKGLYAKARAGLISDFTGIDSPYEEPTDADLVLDTSQLSVEECVDAVTGLLTQRGILS